MSSGYSLRVFRKNVCKTDGNKRYLEDTVKVKKVEETSKWRM